MRFAAVVSHEWALEADHRAVEREGAVPVTLAVGDAQGGAAERFMGTLATPAHAADPRACLAGLAVDYAGRHGRVICQAVSPDHLGASAGRHGVVVVTDAGPGDAAAG